MKINKVSLSTVTCLLALLILSNGCCEVVKVLPGNHLISPDKLNEPLVVTVNVKGPCPEAIGLLTSPLGKEAWGEPIPMNKIADKQYVYTFPTVRESFNYRLNIRVKGSGPYTVIVEGNAPSYEQGRQAAQDWINKKLKDFRIVIMLREMNETDREIFLNGFVSVFAAKGEEEHKKGKDYAKVIRSAVTSDSFNQAKEYGKKHAQNQVTDSTVQNLIRRSLERSRGEALGWKAGYIQGYMLESAKKRHPGKSVEELTNEQKDTLYLRAEVIYEALRPGIG